MGEELNLTTLKLVGLGSLVAALIFVVALIGLPTAVSAEGEDAQGAHDAGGAATRPTLAVSVDHRPTHAREIQLLGLDGRRRRIAPHPPFPLDGAWSPDGRLIAFSGANTEAGGPGHSYGLYVMNARSRRVRLVYAAPRSAFSYMPSWSPDGRRLAFNVSGGGPWVVRSNGRGARRLADLGIAGETAVWSPDGGMLAFGAYDRRGAALYTVHTQGRPRPRRLSRRQNRFEREHEAGVTSPAWSPDGTWIAFGRYLYGAPEVDVVRTDGRDEHRIAYGELPVWSPDGRRIVFVADAPRADENGGGIPVGIALAKPTGKRARVIANPPGREWKATWSADGGRVVFVVGRSSMYIVSPTGAVRRPSRVERKRLRLVATPDQLWASTGALLAGEGDFDRNDYVLRIVTPRGVRMTIRWSIDGSPAWAPGGQKLAFVRRTNTEQIYVLDVAKRQARSLARGDQPVWSPDGNWIAFVRRKSVYVVRASGGPSRLIGAGESAAWSPDGASLAIGGRGLLVARVGDWKPRRIDRVVQIADCTPRPATSAWSPAWSHDGRSIAFAFAAPWCDPGDGRSWFAVVTSDGAAQREFEPAGTNPQWAPDDTVLYFRDYFDDLYSVRVDGSGKTKLMDGPLAWYSLSTNGRWVAYEMSPTDEVWIADLERSSRRLLLRDADGAHPVWRP